MAWFNKYGIPFESKDGTQYMIYILVQSDSPQTVTYLTGADEPFVTSENKDDDIFTPMRGQTGYIRIIDDTQDGSLLASLVPQNNTEKLVVFWSGSWNSSHTNFTPSAVKWRGFLCAEAFTQPWDNGAKMIEIPVISLLTALQYVSLQTSDVSGTMRYAGLFVKAFSALGVSPNYLYLCSNIAYNQSLAVFYSHFLEFKINGEALFEQQDSNDEGQDSFSWVGMSYYDAISSLLRLYGLMAREVGGDLYLIMYDKADNYIQSLRFSWSSVQTIASVGLDFSTPTITVPTDQALLSVVEFAGNNNTEEFVQGARRASVVLPLKSYKVHLNLPLTTEDASTVIEVDVTNPTVGVQPHGPRSNNIETFTYAEYLLEGDDPLAPSNYQACLDNSVLVSTTSWINQHLIAGAFPVRWYFTNNGENVAMLKNGLLLNQRYRRNNVAVSNGTCYRIKTDINYTLQDGYLRIRFNNYNFDQGYMGSSQFPEVPTSPHFGPWSGLVPSPEAMHTEIYVLIRFGEEVWNADTGQWEPNPGINSANFMPITFDNDGVIESNWTEDMQVSEKDGYFIPLPEMHSGDIEFYIADIADCMEGTTFRYVHSRIISDLMIDYLPLIDRVASQRSQNSYRKTILEAGFESEKTVTLAVGTNNNNTPSPVFLLNGADKKFESVTYNITSTQTRSERPEIKLLNRIAAQCQTVRRNYTGQVKSGIDLIKPFSYLSKRFFGIDAKHNWRDDIQEVKFIEVT